jgi:hypothetical protein
MDFLSEDFGDLYAVGLDGSGDQWPPDAPVYSQNLDMTVAGEEWTFGATDFLPPEERSQYTSELEMGAQEVKLPLGPERQYRAQSSAQYEWLSRNAPQIGIIVPPEAPPQQVDSAAVAYHLKHKETQELYPILSPPTSRSPTQRIDSTTSSNHQDPEAELFKYVRSKEFDLYKLPVSSRQIPQAVVCDGCIGVYVYGDWKDRSHLIGLSENLKAKPKCVACRRSRDSGTKVCTFSMFVRIKLTRLQVYQSLAIKILEYRDEKWMDEWQKCADR